MVKGKESLLPAIGSKAAFQNQVYALAVQQGVSILQPALIGKALSKPLEHEHSKSVSEFLLSAGIKSKGAVAITGKHSHLFLYGGSNKVDQLFAPEASLDPRLFDRWEKVVLKRAKLLKDRGCGFVQMIIPEKQSVLPECYHRDITDISPLLASLEAAQLPGWFSALDALRGSDPETLFFKTDSHLNSRGCWQLFSAFLEHQGLSSLPEPSFDREKKYAEIWVKSLRHTLFMKPTGRHGVFRLKRTLNFLKHLCRQVRGILDVCTTEKIRHRLIHRKS